MHTETIGQDRFIFSRVNTGSEGFMREIYHQRYHVFCEECEIVDKDGHTNGMESDRYDPYALHFVAVNHKTLVGNVRLVLSNPLGFPMMGHIKGELSGEFYNLFPYQVAEISRLLITKRFRKKKEEEVYYPLHGRHAHYSERQAIKRARPVIIGLSREMHRECVIRDITHCVALMEKPLWQLLRLYGLKFRPIGDEVDYHGMVRPYMCEVSAIGESL